MVKEIHFKVEISCHIVTMVVDHAIAHLRTYFNILVYMTQMCLLLKFSYITPILCWTQIQILECVHMIHM